MLELYVFAAMYGLGYMWTKMRPPGVDAARPASSSDRFTAPQQQLRVARQEQPSVSNIYTSTHTRRVAAAEARAAQRTMALPAENVVRRQANTTYSHLAGVSMPHQSFEHNNMQPFVKGDTRHFSTNEPFLERTGATQMYYQPKQESGPRFQPQQHVPLPGSDLLVAEAEKDRMAPSRLHNNVSPVDTVRVGPGLGQGFTSRATDGFEAREYALRGYKSVNDLRVATNPRVSYTPPVVEGQRGSVRANDLGEQVKEKIPTVRENTEFFPTTGANLKPRSMPAVDAKATHRQTTSTEYRGVPFAADKPTAPQVRSAEVRESSKPQLEAFELQPASATRDGRGADYDYGKGTILVYTNERDVTAMRTHQGNVTSLVKSMIAPFEDLVRGTRKQTLAEQPQELANVNVQIPSKQPVWDPNNVPRTTIKETMVDNTQAGNVRGPVRSVVWDPNNVARTTNKETFVIDAQLMNIKPRMGAAPQTDHEALKENMRKTLRQTLDEADTALNVKGHTAVAQRAEDDRSKTTHRETMLTEDYGHVGGVQSMGRGYLVGEVSAPTTHRETLVDTPYHGHVSGACQASDAYRVVEVAPKDTQKADLSAREYYGNAASQDSKMMMSYEDIYNATISELRESTLREREPTKTGVKVASGAQDVSMQVRREGSGNGQGQMVNISRVLPPPDAVTDLGELTRERDTYREEPDTRLDEALMAALRENPFAMQPLASVRTLGGS